MKKLLFLAAIVTSATAVAQAPSRSEKSKATADPNQTICRRLANTGSRLGDSRVCMTRQQWDEGRAQTRANILRSQGNSYNKPDGG